MADGVIPALGDNAAVDRLHNLLEVAPPLVVALVPLLALLLLHLQQKQQKQHVKE